jgi:hypothetical protein
VSTKVDLTFPASPKPVSFHNAGSLLACLSDFQFDA